MTSREHDNRPADVSAAPFISVVIPTQARLDLLRNCLCSLLAQTYPADRYEVIVVEDGTGDGRLTGLLADLSATTGVSLRHVVNPGEGPAAARNSGWRVAQGSIIAFTDDDVLIDRDWLAEGARVFQDGVAGVAGRTEVPLPPRPTDYQRNVGGLATSRFITCNVFYRKDSIGEIGGFDERFRRAYREDTDLVFSLREKGLRLAECDTALVSHPPRQARWLSSVHEQSRQMYDALLYKKHPVLFRQSIRRRAPYHYYAVTLGYLGLPLAILTQNWLMVTLLAALILGVLAPFLARRLRGTSHAPAHLLEMIVSTILIPPVAVYWRLRGAWHFRVWFM